MLHKETTKQYKSLSEDLKKEVLEKSKLEKPDYSLSRFNLITKEVYYKSLLKTNIDVVTKHTNTVLSKDNLTKEEILSLSNLVRTLQDFLLQTPEYKELLKQSEEKEKLVLQKLEIKKTEKPKKIVKEKKVSLDNKILKDLGLEKMSDLFDDYNGNNLDPDEDIF